MSQLTDREKLRLLNRSHKYRQVYDGVLWHFKTKYSLSILLSFLIQMQDAYWGAYEDGWFFCTSEKFEERIFMPRESLQRNLRELNLMGLIETKKEGMPPKRFIRVNVDAVLNILQQYEDYVEEQLVEKEGGMGGT